jgi:PPOX class probable F420-dependent enzyme
MTYQYAEMSQAQIEEFLHAPRFAIVGTNRVNGAPQLAPVWYLYENGRIYVSMSVDSAKYRNLRRDSRIGICISGSHPDARAVMIYGTVDLVPEDAAVYEDIDWRLTRRYHDSDEEAQAFIDSLPADQESALAVVTPDKIIAEDYN